MTTTEKGNQLEDAVRKIETAILRSCPSYSEATFEIESKKVFVVQGVRHEVDICVTARPAPSYDARFLFECKNREEKVSKNDIIVFSEKVKVCQAARGFFVAKGFTQDAVAQAALDPRLELLKATEILEFADGSLFQAPHRLNVYDVCIHVSPSLQWEQWGKPFSLSLPFATGGKTTTIQRFADEWSRRLRDMFPSRSMAADSYPFAFELWMRFAPFEALLGGFPIAELVIGMEGVAVLERAVLVHAFDVETRGRTVRYLFENALPALDGLLIREGPIDMTITPISAPSTPSRD